MIKEKVMDILRKLMAHRDSAYKIESFEEAETFAGKINELLLKHKLSLSEIEMHEQDVADPFGDSRFEPSEHGVKYVSRRVWWQEEIAGVVARAHFCKILIISGTNRTVFVGRESDRQVTVYLYTYLVRMLGDYAKRKVASSRKALRAEGQYVSGWKASFMRGAISTLRERFQERRAETERAAPGSTALVRATQQLDQFFKEKFRYTRSAGSVRGTSNFTRGAYDQGRQYASQISLRRGVSTSGDGPKGLKK